MHLLVVSLIMNNALCLYCDYYRNNNYLQQIQITVSEVNNFADNKSVSHAVHILRQPIVIAY